LLVFQSFKRNSFTKPSQSNLTKLRFSKSVKCFVRKIPNKYPLWVRRDMKRTFLQFFQSSVIINIVLFSSLLVLTEISRESIFLLLCLLLLLHRFRSGYLLRWNKLLIIFWKLTLNKEISRSTSKLPNWHQVSIWTTFITKLLRS